MLDTKRTRSLMQEELANCTVVIPSCNRSAVLEKTIESYVNNRPDEILIIAYGEKEEYLEISRKYTQMNSGRTSVRVIFTSKQSAARSRNLGIANATNPIIIFGEDDAYIDEYYCREISRRISEDDTRIYSGCLLTLKADTYSGISDLLHPIAVDEPGPLFDENLFFYMCDKIPVRDMEIPLTHALFGYSKYVYSDLRFFEGFSARPEFREESSLQMEIARTSHSLKVATVCSGIYAYHMNRRFVTQGNKASPIRYLVFSIIDTCRFIYIYWDVISRILGKTHKELVCIKFALSQVDRTIGRRIRGITKTNKMQEV